MLSKPPTDAAFHLKELFSLSPAKSTTEPTEGSSFCCALTYLIKPLRIQWVAMKFHHHCKFGSRRVIQGNYFQTQNLYSKQSKPGQMKLQKTTPNSVNNFKPTTETRLLKEKPEKQMLKKRDRWFSAAELHQGRTRKSVHILLWRHPVRKRRFSSQKMPCLQHVQSQVKTDALTIGSIGSNQLAS